MCTCLKLHASLVKTIRGGSRAPSDLAHGQKRQDFVFLDHAPALGVSMLPTLAILALLLAHLDPEAHPVT